MIYLDNAATTYPKPDIVYDVMDRFLRTECVNAGRGSYKSSIKASELIDETRNLLLELISAKDKGKVIFSPSATIAINQVLRGLEWENIKNVYVSPFEHNSIMRTLHDLKKRFNFNVNIIPFDNITFELDEVKLKIDFSKHKPDLVLLSHVSNVTGFILPVGRISCLSEQYNPINVIDCSQTMGIVPIDISDEFSTCDFLVFAGHKSLYGPFGVAGFIQINSKLRLREVLTGGTGSDSTNLDMPDDDVKRYEMGSYNVQAIVGLNTAIKWIKSKGIENIYSHEKEISKYLVGQMSDIPGIELYIPENLERHIGIVSFNIDGYSADEVGKILDEEYDICVRSGHHCAPYIGTFLNGHAVNGTVRCSVSYFTNKEEIKKLIEAVQNL